MVSARPCHAQATSLEKYAMRQLLRTFALISVAALVIANSGCASFDWLMDAEQRKNEWLRETFFGGGGGQFYQSNYGSGYDHGAPCNCAPQ
jgi:hypothetical protein